MTQNEQEMSGKMRTWIAIIAILIPILLSFIIENYL